MSRRTFLYGGAGALVGGFALTAPAFRPQHAIAQWVRSRFPGVRIATEDLTLFTQDILQVWKLSPGRRRIVYLLMRRPGLRPLVPAATLESVERQERWILTKFLMSSDMFDDGWDGRTIAYNGFSDPYELGCSNPVARQADA